MRIDAVIASAFGPFRERRFELAPGMNVIFGLNEAGKSSLHAALYAGLCGVRRGRGQPRKDDQRFAELHRPWDESGRWAVGAVISLAAGRRVEIHHDLNGRVDCRATDDFGRDVSSEIMNEGTPDASRWLGLDRRSFLSTACVGQTDVMAILDDASELQEELQRAAASAGRDKTAAGALAIIEDFRREQVGKDQVHARKPLRRAKEQVQKAKTDLGMAVRDHELLIELSTSAQLAAADEAGVLSEIRLLEAASAKSQGDVLAANVARVRELSARLTSDRPPDLTEENEFAELVARATQAWTERPSIPDLTGPTSEDLARALGELPAMPEGDLEPDSGVQDSFESYQRARQAVELHDLTRPNARDASSPVAEDELLRLAKDLETVVPQVDPVLRERRERLRKVVEVSAGTRFLRKSLWIAAALSVGAGLVVFARGSALWGAGLLVLGSCLGLLAWGGRTPRARLLDSLREVEGSLGAQLHATLAAEERLRAASDDLKRLGLPVSADSLRLLAEEVGASRRERAELSVWAKRRSLLDEAVQRERMALEKTLAARGETLDDDAIGSMKRYLASCQERERSARLAAERPRLESRLADRLLAEQAAFNATAQGGLAERRIRDAAMRVGLPQSDIESLLVGLETWRQDRQQRLRQLESERHDWATVEALLAGRTIEELERQAQDASDRASRLLSTVDTKQLESLSPDGDLESRLVNLRAIVNDASRRVGDINARLAEQKQRNRSVAEAEERLARAEADLDRVVALDDTLSQAQSFLEKAQERVHRTIAPVLRDTLNKWLPRTTGGRYAESVVDPATLEVRIRAAGGTWREAGLVSQGTAEQVYLLLRLALAEHLTRESGEVCPVVLDDVLVQTDDDRKEALLDLLHEISGERQIILFTMEQIAVDWAEAHLKAPKDLVIRLDPSEVGA